MQQKFVAEYLRTSQPRASAVSAGYGEKNAKSMAYQLLKHPLVKVEIEKARALVQEEGIYNLKKAMADADEAYQVAKEKNNPAAMTAAATLKAKLSGLMVERSEVKSVGFQIVISGYEDK